MSGMKHRSLRTALFAISFVLVVFFAPYVSAEEGGLGHCPTACGDHYVAYEMENHASVGGQEDDHYLQDSDVRLHRIFDNTGQVDRANLTGPAEARIEKENGTFAVSTYRAEILKVGEMRKSETMVLNTPSTEDGTVARVRMVFGDTLKISSQTLKKETPVKVVIHRKVGGFGGPVTPFAFYHGISQTLIDGKTVADLSLDLSKKAGPENKDQSSGHDDLDYTLETRIGDTVFIEGILQVEDGLSSDGKTQQMLNGADSVKYTLSLPEGSDVCVTSSSGLLSAGSCR